MTSHAFRTKPDNIATMPPGIPFIVGNEAAERFSYYGIQAIQFVYLTEFLRSSTGELEPLSPERAKVIQHLFIAAAYAFPVLGAILSDAFLGKFWTIICLSLVYCGGHVWLSATQDLNGFMIGMWLLAIGAGGIKPCVSAHVGDQFGTKNQHLVNRVFSIFYFSINLGAFASTLLTPWLLKNPDYGPEWAFGVPAVLMFLATVVFWVGRFRYAHIPAGGMAFIKETFEWKGVSALLGLCPLFAFISIFWCLFDQTHSTWVEQANKMDRVWLGIEWDGSQVQAANPALVMLIIPLCNVAIYPLLNRVARVGATGKIAIGFFLAAFAFSISGLIQVAIDAGGRPHISWQILAYFFLTLAEVLVSITALEFSYTQAPNQMKSLVMSLYLLSVAVGNGLTSAVNQLIQNADETVALAGASYYWFFTGLMFVTSVLFLPYAAFYRETRYVQGLEEPVAAPDPDASDVERV